MFSLCSCNMRLSAGGAVHDKEMDARNLSTFMRFEDEAGQGLRPPRGSTWARRCARLVGGGLAGPVSIARWWCATAVGSVLPAALLPPPQGEAKGLTWGDYRAWIIATHRQLAASLGWCWGQPEGTWPLLERAMVHAEKTAGTSTPPSRTVRGHK